jgi:putative component of membrane protein insertase Oxa1/YidC/SpoIIIJ protein YidD
MPHSSDYENFAIESFEAGTGLWHARFRRCDCEPVLIDGIALSSIEVGFAWPSPDAAIRDEKSRIDRLKPKIVSR